MLDFDKVKKLHEIAHGNDKAEISLLHNAVLDRMNAYKERSTAANKKDWDAAKEGLADSVARLWPKYFPGEGESLEPEVFTKQKDAYAWLKRRGCKVSTGKFSKDWNTGAVRLQSDKSVLRADLIAYAASLDLDQRSVEDAQKRAARKDELEIRRLEQQIEKAEIENRKADRQWILREEAEQNNAEKVLIVYNAILTRLHLDQDVILQSLDLPRGKAPEMIMAVRDTIDRAYNDLERAGHLEVAFDWQDEQDAAEEIEHE